MTGVELLLVRHGNTFGPGDRVSWVGRGEDLPLVDSGREQARALHATLAAADWRPDTAVSGELVRQREHLALATGGAPEPVVDPRLDEVDYGAWGGLTTEEIEARFGAESVAGWNERSQVPAGAGWPEGRDELVARAHDFARDVAAGRFGERVLVCSSNGLIRWFLGLEEGALERALAERTFKVRTGHYGLLRHGVAPGGQGAPGWRIESWNQAPSTPLVRNRDDAVG